MDRQTDMQWLQAMHICTLSCYSPKVDFEWYALQSPKLTVGFKVHHLIELHLMVTTVVKSACVRVESGSVRGVGG